MTLFFSDIVLFSRYGGQHSYRGYFYNCKVSSGYMELAPCRY